MNTFGLDGILPWHQARNVAATAARPLETTAARLDEAHGARLARALSTMQDDPPVDSAGVSGFALCGEGPWMLRDLVDAPLRPGEAQRVHRGEPIPEHCDCVVRAETAQESRDRDDNVIVIALDPLTGIPDERVRPDLGEGIVRQGARSLAGHDLVATGRIVTPSVISLAAALGHDHLDVIRTPVVGTLILGSHLIERGLPRQGRPRDALGAAIPAFVGAWGARGNPAVRAPDTVDLLLAEIDDAAVDVLITTGSTAPGPENHLRQVLRDLGARWLVDGVAVYPGDQMLLARLPDGRLLVGLPGSPASALAALVTLLPPLIRGLRGDEGEQAPATAVLLDDAPQAPYADDTVLVPVRLRPSRAGMAADPIRVQTGGDLAAWAAADAIAVVPPGSGARGDVVEYLTDPIIPTY